MRATSLAVALVVLLGASGAAAQNFGNRGLALSLGFTRISADNEPITWAFSVPQLEGSYYLESGFELYARVPLLLGYSALSADASHVVSTRPSLVLGTGGQAGARYLFLEEAIRPWVGLHVSCVYFVRDSVLGPNLQIGPGVNAGVEFFVADSISVGARGTFDLFLVLNAPFRFAGGGALTASTYF